jgi:hypothetical protein
MLATRSSPASPRTPSSRPSWRSTRRPGPSAACPSGWRSSAAPGEARGKEYTDAEDKSLYSVLTELVRHARRPGVDRRLGMGGRPEARPRPDRRGPHRLPAPGGLGPAAQFYLPGAVTSVRSSTKGTARTRAPTTSWPSPPAWMTPARSPRTRPTPRTCGPGSSTGGPRTRTSPPRYLTSHAQRALAAMKDGTVRSASPPTGRSAQARQGLADRGRHRLRPDRTRMAGRDHRHRPVRRLGTHQHHHHAADRRHQHRRDRLMAQPGLPGSQFPSDDASSARSRTSNGRSSSSPRPTSWPPPASGSSRTACS